MRIVSGHPFVGREAEFEDLQELQKRNAASLVIVQGRRRIGKSRLIEEFAKGQKFYCIVGIAPTKETTAQMQRDAFARQLGEQLDLPKFIMSDWGDLFTFLSKYTNKRKVVFYSMDFMDGFPWRNFFR